MAVGDFPSAIEWDFSGLPSERRHYLEPGVSLEDIARYFGNAATCMYGEIQSLRDSAPGAPPLITWRACFKVSVDCKIADLFFNGRDGLRGRYWLSPAAGEAATRILIESLKTILFQYMIEHPHCMRSAEAGTQTLEGIERSLDAASSKIWAHENVPQNFNEGPKLLVRRWKKSLEARWAPQGPLVDIKGAWFTPQDHEHITKPHRSRDIHELGFS